jgi:transcriptional regulator with XRE-family HTH domain
MNDAIELGMFNFGDRLKILREKTGLSQQEFGLRVGRRQRDISRYERNQVKPDIEVVRAICLEFDVSPNYLLDLNPARKENELSRNAWRAALAINKLSPEDQETAIRLVEVLTQELEVRHLELSQNRESDQ